MIATKKIINAKPAIVAVKSDIISSKIDVASKPLDAVNYIHPGAKSITPEGLSMSNPPSKLTPLSGGSSLLTNSINKRDDMTSLSNLPSLTGGSTLTSLANLPSLVKPLHSKNLVEITKMQTESSPRKVTAVVEDFEAGHTDSEDDKF
jgi:hypothetical protein